MRQRWSGESDKFLSNKHGSMDDFTTQMSKHAEELSKHAEEMSKHAEEMSKHAEEMSKHAEELRKHAEEMGKMKFSGGEMLTSSSSSSNSDHGLKIEVPIITGASMFVDGTDRFDLELSSDFISCFDVGIIGKMRGASSSKGVSKNIAIHMYNTRTKESAGIEGGKVVLGVDNSYLAK
jgi:hypothetical protein